MTFKSKLFTGLALAAVLMLVACGPTYVQPVAYQQQQQFNPGYDPNQFLYDAMLANAVVNGINGYYGPGHVFYPMVTVGGVGGYYDSGHHFHTSVQNKTVVINNYNTEKTKFQQQVSQKPNYGTQQGTIGRGPSTQQSAPQATQKPNYGAQQGTIGRGAPQQAPVVTSKPNYGSSTGTMQRSAPSAPARQSYSALKPSYSSPSSSGGMSRRK
jgi:hypothetical protein